MFRLFCAIIRHKLQELLSFSFVLQFFLSYCIEDPFCITNLNYCLYGVRCPLLFIFGGGGFFVGKSSGCSCLRLWKGLVSLRFLYGCLSPGLAVGQGVWASVSLWCIPLLAGVVGFTRHNRMTPSTPLINVTTVFVQNI